MRERTWLAGSAARVLLAVLLAGGAAARAAADDGDAVAIVNGRALSARRLNEVLRDGYGLQVLQQLIVLELAKEETRRLKLRVTAADVEAELALALQRIAPQAGADGQPLSPDEQRQALDFLLQQKCLSMAEFRIGMERNAHLRKVVERDFRVDEATLREEFARTHGEKVEVRHIQVADIGGLHEALNLLDRGTDFAEVARRVSQNPDTAARGGLLEPFTFDAPDDQIAAVLREAAFALRPGEVTKPIKTGRWWHILKLERRLPADSVRFEDVRADVERRLRERVIPERMNALVTELFRKAEVRVLDNELRRRYEELVARGAAASPPAGP